MSSPKRHTPSSVLRDTLLEYSRERRKRTKTQNRSQERQEEVTATSPEEVFLYTNPSVVQSYIPGEVASSLSLLEESSMKDIAVEVVPEAESQLIQVNLSDTLLDDEIAVDNPAADIASLTSIVSTSAIFFDFDDNNVDTAESLQNVPGIDCLCCCFTSPKYYVPLELRQDENLAQTHFIQKVFAVFLAKVVIILAWLRTVEMLDNFRKFYDDTFQYHFVSGGIYLAIKIAIRITKNFRKKHCCMHVFLLILELFAACDFVACAISHWLQDYFSVPRKILFTTAAVAAFYIFVGFFTAYDMRDGIMMGSALIVTGVMAVHQMLHEKTKFTGIEAHAGKIIEELICTGAVFLVSELVMIIVMFELTSVLTGRRYSPSPSDWFFTAIYII